MSEARYPSLVLASLTDDPVHFESKEMRDFADMWLASVGKTLRENGLKSNTTGEQ